MEKAFMIVLLMMTKGEAMKDFENIFEEMTMETN
jgi:hypothetical protein